MEKLLEILKTIKPGVDFSASQNIIEDRLLTSLEIVMLVGKLSDEFDIEIGVSDLRPENFKDLDAIMNMIHRLEEE